MDQQHPGDREKSIPIPRSFFDLHFSQVNDIAELKTLLTFFRLVAEPDWSYGMIPEELLLSNEELLESLRPQGSTRAPVDQVRKGIELAIARDALLRFRVEQPPKSQSWLMASGPHSRARLARLQRGEEPIPRLIVPDGEVVTIRAERPNVFRLYEQNIGLLTPIIADQLIEALEIYPESWIEEAIGEAVSYNRRQWRYVQRVLNNWATEGRGHETDKRHRGAGESADPEKYLRGKYAALFRRRK